VRIGQTVVYIEVTTCDTDRGFASWLKSVTASIHTGKLVNNTSDVFVLDVGKWWSKLIYVASGYVFDHHASAELYLRKLFSSGGKK
jgi:hypothetical protein